MKKYEYGKSPNPKNWHEAAEALKSLTKKPRKNRPESEKDKK